MLKHLLVALTLAAACLSPSAGPPARAQSSPAPTKGQAALLAVVNNGSATWLDRQTALRSLVRVADDAAVPSMATLLGDPELAQLARAVLEAVGSPIARQALRDALPNTTGDLKVGVIHSLTYLRDGQSVPAFITLSRDAHPQTRQSAIAGLGHLATEPALQALASLRGGPDAASQPVIAEASLVAAERLADDGQAEPAMAILRELRGPAWPESIRTAAFVGMLHAEPGRPAVARVVEAIRGDDALRLVAIAHVASSRDVALGASLAPELAQLSPPHQAQLIEAMTHLRTAPVRDAVAGALGSDHADVRAAAAKALGTLGDASVVPALVHTLTQGPTAGERKNASVSLIGLPGKDVNPAVAAALAGVPQEQRVPLIDVLNARNATSAWPELKRQVASEHRATSLAAVRALSRIGQAAQVEEVLDLLATLPADSAARGDVERLVVALARKAGGGSASQPMLARLGAASTPADRLSLLRVLGSIADDKALEAVKQAMTDSDPAVRTAALDALATWPNDKPLDTLVEIVSTTDDANQRTTALRGAARLLANESIPARQRVAVYLQLLEKAQTDDRKLILAGLATVPSVEALPLITPLLDDPSVTAEAQLAALGVLEATMGTQLDQARELAKRIETQATIAGIRSRAKALNEKLNTPGDAPPGGRSPAR